MSNKEIIRKLLAGLPDDVPLPEVARKLQFIAAVQAGIAELDRGQRVPIEEVERELPSWIHEQWRQFQEPSLEDRL